MHGQSVTLLAVGPAAGIHYFFKAFFYKIVASVGLGAVE